MGTEVTRSKIGKLPRLARLFLLGERGMSVAQRLSKFKTAICILVRSRIYQVSRPSGPL